MKNSPLPLLCALTVLLVFGSCGQAGYTKDGDATPNLTDAAGAGVGSDVFSDASSMQQTATDEQVNALYAQLRSGQTITLERQIYYLDAPLVLDVVENFTLDGQGASLIMRDKDEDVIRISSSSKVVLKNFTATHVEPEGPLGCRGSVIQVFDSSDILVENCRLNGSGIIGIVAYGVEDLQVNNNYIFNNSRYGLLFDTDTSLELTYNRFEDNGASGTMHLAKALNLALTDVEQIAKDQVATGLKMSRNKFE